MIYYSYSGGDGLEELMRFLEMGIEEDEPTEEELFAETVGELMRALMNEGVSKEESFELVKLIVASSLK